jgi:lipoprotein-releasing system ATP-binding protein
MSSILALSGIRRTYTQGPEKLEVLRGVNLEIKAGETVALVGPSGSGKTTLLQITGLLDAPTAGSISIDGTNLTGATDAVRTAARGKSLGFVYQFHHLLPDFTALENVAMPMIISGVARAAAHARAEELLKTLGLAARATHHPARLSGGEQQRVAMARALANSPKLLLADEPTGNLDPHTAAEVMDYLLKLAKQHKLAALIATHNMELAKRTDRIVTLKDGALS